MGVPFLNACYVYDMSIEIRARWFGKVVVNIFFIYQTSSPQ